MYLLRQYGRKDQTMNKKKLEYILFGMGNVLLINSYTHIKTDQKP